jgi:hypothetical protein
MSIVRDFLKQKDGDYNKYIPQAYQLSDDDKKKVLFMQAGRAKYELDTAAKCIKPCFRVFNTGMVTETESECMTNCVAKGLETLSLLQLQYA